jgi:hypothetical protein
MYPRTRQPGIGVVCEKANAIENGYGPNALAPPLRLSDLLRPGLRVRDSLGGPLSVAEGAAAALSGHAPACAVAGRAWMIATTDAILILLITLVCYVIGYWTGFYCRGMYRRKDD